MNRIKGDAHYSGILKPMRQVESTVSPRKIAQPVKIAQLFGPSGRLKNSQNDLTIQQRLPERLTPYRKKVSSQKKPDLTIQKSLPERLTPYLKKVSSQKNPDLTIQKSLPERLTPYLKKVSSQKKPGTNIHAQLPRNERGIRRNLIFPEDRTKIKAETCVDTNDKEDNPKTKNLPLFTRKSYLVPPNTIKELHVQTVFKRNRFEKSQFSILTMNSENTNPGLLVASKGCSAKVENTNMHADSAVHVKSVLLHTLNLNEQSGINILHSSFTDLAETGNGAVEKVLENLNSNKISNDICQNNDCNVTTNRSHLHPASDTDVKTACPCDNNDTEQKDSSTEHHSPTTCILSGVRKVKENLLERVKAEECSPIPEEDLQSSLQIAKIIKEECLNLQRSANGDKSVTLNKTELTVLLSKLKNLICRLEEDVADFKLTLTTVTELLCATNVANMKSEDNKETEVAQQIIETTENLNDNTKVTDTMDSKLPLGRIDTERDNSSDETLKMLNIDDNFLEMNDKENEENLNSPLIKQCITSERRRRSARLMAKVLQNSNAVSDSFENLENELEIVNKKFNTPLKSRTPAKNKYQDKKVEGRPMKEYMALRSRMSCLSTPNTKRLNFSKSTNNIDYEANNSNTSVSNKVFAELYSLYEDSV